MRKAIAFEAKNSKKKEKKRRFYNFTIRHVLIIICRDLNTLDMKIIVFGKSI
jgi:hypothetical protein